MLRPITADSSDSNVFYVERSTGKQSRPRNYTPDALNSRELSGAPAREVITISSVTSPEPYIVTFEPDSNEPTMPYGYKQRQPIIPPSLKT